LNRTSQGFTVRESSEIGYVRRKAAQISEALGFDSTLAGQVAIIVTEMGTNLIRHAEGGELVINSLLRDGSWGIEILSLDQGKGMRNLQQCMADGFSTGTSPGTGLGSIQRQATEFDIFSHPELGTAILASVWPRGKAPRPGDLFTGGVCLAFPGETQSGDAWSVIHPSPHAYKFLVADGLGHGDKAAEASREAVTVFERAENISLSTTIGKIHQALRKTRGAAVGISEIDLEKGSLTFSGVGNISATLCTPPLQKGIPSSNGIVGHTIHKTSDFLFAWGKDDVLILHSDGLQTRWNLNQNPAYIGLTLHHPTLLAGVLYRDFRRSNDDCTVVAVKQNPHPLVSYG